MTSKPSNQIVGRAGGGRGDRWPALDALRGVAVVLMVQQHLGVWLAFALGMQSPLWPLLRAVNMAGGAAAPLFIFLSGVGVAIAEARGHLAASVWALRGVVLFGFGVLLNLLVPHWLSPGSFYVLHLLGVWLLLAPWIAKAQGPSLLAIGLSIVCLGAIIQIALGTPLALGNQALADASKAGGIFRLALGEGHFPIFPWLAPAIVGLWAGRRLVAREFGRVLSVAVGLSGVSALLLGAGWIHRGLAVQSPFRQFVRFSFYPATASFMLALLAISLLAVVSVAKLDPAAPWNGSTTPARTSRPNSLLGALGRTSLTLLFVHVVVFREVFELAGLRNQLSAEATLATIVAFIVGWAWLSRIWLRADLILSLEWWLRRAPRAVLAASRAQERPR